jgi:hypothetical protein
MADESDTTARTLCPAFERLVIAYHESGHAIVDHAVWPPNPVVRVTIIPTDEHDGVVELAGRGEAWLFEVDDDLAEALVAEADTIQHLAGNAAAGVFLGVEEQLPLPPAWSGDHQNADASALCTWDGADGQSLHPRDYLERTREVLERPDVQLAVPRLAAALLRHKTVSGAEVEDIVRDCGVTCERAELPLGWPDSDDDFDDEAYSWSRW